MPDQYKKILVEALRKKAQYIESTTQQKLYEIRSPSNLVDAVELVTPLRESDSIAAAKQIKRNGKNGFRKVVGSVVHGFSDELLDRYFWEVDIEAFAKEFVSNHLEEPFEPGFHLELFDICNRIEAYEIKTPTIIAGFPGCGKTTILALLLPIHNICCGKLRLRPNGVVTNLRRKYHWHISSTAPMARKNLYTVMHEFEENQRLIDVYGAMYLDASGKKDSRNWSVTAATTHNGVYMEAKGRGATYRTAKHGSARPDLIMADDVQPDQSLESTEQREKDITWATGVLMGRFAPISNLIMLGNMQHDFSTMSRMIKHGKSKGWVTKIYKMYETDPDTGDKIYLMPSRFGPEIESEKRDELFGAGVFDQEMLQSTSAGEPEISYEDFEFVSRAEVEAKLVTNDIYMAMDPAVSLDKKADFSAIVGIVFDALTGVSYMLPCVHGHLSITSQVNVVISEYFRYMPYKFGIEKVAYQGVLRPLIEAECIKKGATIILEDITQSSGGGNIKKRIRRIFAAIKQKTLRFIIDDPEHQICIDQLITISRNAAPEHDDIADALEMAMRLKEEEMTSLFQNQSGIEAEIGG